MDMHIMLFPRLELMPWLRLFASTQIEPPLKYTEYILQGVLFFLQASLERSLLFSTFLAPLLLLKATQFGRTLQ